MLSDRSRVSSESPARLEVRLLGAVEVILDGRRLGAFNNLRLQRFLALITLRRDLQHRSRLAFELWPDSNERQARTNLRKLLHNFRHSLPDIGEFVEIDNEIVRWIPTGPSEVDVLRFREAIAVGDLELAARLYSGDLLPACYDDWVLDERAKLRAEAYGAFVRLTEEAAERDDHNATIKQAQRVVDLEPTDEAAVRIQMEAHLALGDRAAALRSYHRCAEVLDRDLGVAPGEAIRAMYRQLRAGTVNREDVRGEDLAPVGESPFVGRDLELNQLNEAWSTVREGGAHLVLVTGEPGIGKSRLAMEFGRRVRAEGNVVASARAYEAAGRLPWGPMVDLLRSNALRSHIDTLDTVWRAELARLLPELLDAAQPSGPSQSGDLAQRHRLFDAVNRAITVGDRPRLLIIDDLQWCDAETIELIGFVVRSGQATPVLIVGTVRLEEIPEHHPLVRLVDALGHDQAVTTVPLERLDEATTATLAGRLRNADTIDPELAARLWVETEGNPLFVIEVLRAGVSPEGSQAALTPTMRAVLGARLGQLPDGARRLAEVAAVIGRPFSVGLLVSATGIGEPELVDHLDELWRRRIIRDQGLTYDFSHDKLRAVALEMLSRARRRQLHRAVAEAIAVEFQDHIDAASPQLAAHYDQAGMVEPAIDAYRRAGARAVAVSALDEAVTTFRRALSLLTDLPSSPDRDALELDVRIALGSPLVALEFRLHEVGDVVGGPLFYDYDDATAVLECHRSFINEAPEQLGCLFGWQIAPPLPFIPEDRVGDLFCVLVTCWSGSHEEAEQVLRPLRDVAEVKAELVEVMPFPALQSAFDDFVPKGMQNYWKADFATELTDAAIAAHVEHGKRTPNVSSSMHLHVINGAAQRVGADETAFGHRDKSFAPVIVGIWPDPADNEANTKWVRDYYAAIHPHSGSAGGYVNFMSGDDAHRAAENYGANYERLSAVMAAYDPDNLFHVNQNIAPAKRR